MAKDMEKEFCYMIMLEFMKGIGNAISNMEKGIKNLLMGAHMKEIMLMENQKVLESMYGPMESSTKDNGLEVKSKDLECGEEPKVILILENGKGGKQMDMEFIRGLTEIAMKDNLKIAWNTEKELKSLQMVIYIVVLMKKESPQDSENTIG